MWGFEPCKKFHQPTVLANTGEKLIRGGCICYPASAALQVLSRAESGQLRLLYVAPEKLSAFAVMSCLLRLSPLPLVCVDEAHCMSEWGQGFRPAYFRCVGNKDNAALTDSTIGTMFRCTPCQCCFPLGRPSIVDVVASSTRHAHVLPTPRPVLMGRRAISMVAHQCC